ncbi:MAG TPA: CPBP family intramembrane glutamic endopeptidase, partial [Acidobacteriota bacterium]|nr:CPBP family intramembrane glutamic endopeptidase [Acidobacteriota bacterium]
GDPHDAIFNPPGRPWGIAFTLIFSAVIAIVYVVTSGFVVSVSVGLLSVHKPQIDLQAQLSQLMSNGFVISIASISGSIVGSALIVLAASLRRGLALSEYLCLKPVPLPLLGKWLVAVIILLALADLSNWLLARPIVPPFMVQVYATAEFKSLLFLAIVVAAPLVEELFFRGFLFAGLANSRLGPRCTIAITAIAWGSIHTQYELIDILLICFLGVIFGIARWKTGSIYTTMVLHALTNLGALIEVWLLALIGM